MTNLLMTRLSLYSLLFNNNFLDRRSFLTRQSISTFLTNTNFDNIFKKNISSIDYYSHWSIYNIIPPPIEKVITYNELLMEIEKNNIASLQRAPQHDCIIATTQNGHRWTCLIKDNKLNILISDIENIKSDLTILPIDKNLENIRKAWQFYIISYLTLFITSEFGLIDIDMIGYSSL